MSDKRKDGRDPKARRKTLESPGMKRGESAKNLQSKDKPGMTKSKSKASMGSLPTNKDLASSPRGTGTPAGNVKVVCRFRPLNSKEKNLKGEAICVDLSSDNRTVTINSMKETETSGTQKYKFSFDRTFGMNSRQDEVYQYAAKPIIESVLEGFNGTIFAYGQTASGKTHTMQGPDIDDLELKGIIPRMITTVFEKIEASAENLEFTVKVAMVEIYLEKIRDLLDPTKTNLKIHEDKHKGIFIGDVTESYVAEEEEVYEIMRIGTTNRSISATGMNEGSSRSHSIFIMTISQNNVVDFSAQTGKLFLVDLAGSEKIAKTGAEGKTLEEAKKINQSLTTLGKVIYTLTDKSQTHIPYRDSKLTRILQESLGGNAKTSLIITCSPSVYNVAETISTLRFGERAKSIKNKPQVNKELTVAQLQLLLNKAEKKILFLEKRIILLEDTIIELGGAVPDASLVATADQMRGRQVTIDENVANTLPKEGEESPSDSDDDQEGSQFTETIVEETEGESLLDKVETINKYRELENAKEEESGISEEHSRQMEGLQEDLRRSTDKFKKMRKEYSQSTAQCRILETENDKLINEKAKLTLKLQSVEDQLQDKDDKIQELNLMKTSFENEIQGLEKSKRYLQDTITKLEAEVETQEVKLAKQVTLTASAQAEDKIKSLKSEVERKELILRQIACLPDLDENILKLVAEEISASTKLEAYHSDSTSSLIDRQNQQREGDKPSLEKSNQELLEQLQSERERREKLEMHTTKLETNLNEMMSSSNPNIEAIQKKMIDDAIARERNKFEEEKKIILKDLKNRVDKVVRLEIELDEAHESYRVLENEMAEGDKALKKKVNSLERNLEQLTIMYHQIMTQKSALKVDNQVKQKKIIRKNERIENLEKQLEQTTDLVAHYKQRCDLLKQNVQVGVAVGGASIVGTNKIKKHIKGGKRFTPRGKSMHILGHVEANNPEIQGS